MFRPFTVSLRAMTIPALALFLLAAVACASEPTPAPAATPSTVQIMPTTVPTAAPTPDLVGTITAAIAAITAAQPTPTPTSPDVRWTMLTVRTRKRFTTKIWLTKTPNGTSHVPAPSTSTKSLYMKV